MGQEFLQFQVEAHLGLGVDEASPAYFYRCDPGPKMVNSPAEGRRGQASDGQKSCDGASATFYFCSGNSKGSMRTWGFTPSIASQKPRKEAGAIRTFGECRMRECAYDSLLFC